MSLTLSDESLNGWLPKLPLESLNTLGCGTKSTLVRRGVTRVDHPSSLRPIHESSEGSISL